MASRFTQNLQPQFEDMLARLIRTYFSYRSYHCYHSKKDGGCGFKPGMCLGGGGVISRGCLIVEAQCVPRRRGILSVGTKPPFDELLALPSSAAFQLFCRVDVRYSTNVDGTKMASIGDCSLFKDMPHLP